MKVYSSRNPLKVGCRSLCVVRLLLLAFCPCGARGEESLSWPEQGPYERVGGKSTYSYKATVMPVAVIKATEHQLGGTPAQWEVEVDTNYARQHIKVVNLYSGRGYAKY